MDQDIQQRVDRAIKLGAPKDEAIRRGMAKQAERNAQTTQTSGMSITKPEFSKPEPQKGLLQSVGEGAIGVGKSLLQPFKGLAADVVDIGKFAFQGGEKAFAGGYKNPFRSEEELTKVRNREDLGGFATDQAKKTAGIMSFAVPFGKAGFAGSKFVVPGAAVGAGQEIAQDEATPDSVLGAGVVGGVTGGVMQGAGAVVNKIKGSSKILDKQATTLEEGTRKIRIKPSVSGAQQEKAIKDR